MPGQWKTEAVKAMALGPTRMMKPLKGLVITNGIARNAYKFHLIACLQASSLNTHRCSCGGKCAAMPTARESVAALK